MTLITAMKFNPHEGAIIADEEVTNSDRKYQLASKIHELSANNIIALFGGCGASDVLCDSVIQIEDSVKMPQVQIQNNQDIANHISYVFGQVKKQYRNGYLKDKFGISEEEFHAGKKIMSDGNLATIAKSLMERYYQTVDEKNEFAHMVQNAFLILTKDTRGIGLFIASMNLERATPVPRPYAPVGSGYDIADKVLYEFFEDIPRDKRDSVDPIDGIAALLNAVACASTRNIGVGGTPLIKVIRHDTIIRPNENNSRLALEITKAAEHNFLSKEFKKEALDALIYQNVPFADVEQKMFNQTKCPENLSYFLRGYKL